MTPLHPSEDALLALSAMQREIIEAEKLALRRYRAFEEAKVWRRRFFALKRRYDADPWVWGQFGWGDDGERNTAEELERIRGNGREAVWGVDRHGY